MLIIAMLNVYVQILVVQPSVVAPLAAAPPLDVGVSDIKQSAPALQVWREMPGLVGSVIQVEVVSMDTELVAQGKVKLV